MNAALKDDSSDKNQPESTFRLAPVSFLLSGILDSISFALFYLSFSTLTHLITAISVDFLTFARRN